MTSLEHARIVRSITLRLSFQLGSCLIRGESDDKEEARRPLS